MIHFLSWLAFGDCLISGSLLEQVEGLGTRARVVGTSITEAVFPLLRRPPVVEATVFAGMPAFYSVRAHSAWTSIRHLHAASSWVGQHLRANDVAVFENGTSVRNALICARAGCRRIEVPRVRGAYQDRYDRYSALLPGMQPFQPAAQPDARATRLLVNPCARSRDRQLPFSMVEGLIRRAAIRGVETVLLDMNGDFAGLRDQVTTYAREPALADSVALLKSSDRYAGPDSFFVHLAYYFRVPSLSVFHRDNVYFMPPGVSEQRSYLYFDELADLRAVDQQIDAFL